MDCPVMDKAEFEGHGSFIGIISILLQNCREVPMCYRLQCCTAIYVLCVCNMVRYVDQERMPRKSRKTLLSRSLFIADGSVPKFSLLSSISQATTKCSPFPSAMSALGLMSLPSNISKFIPKLSRVKMT